ncbi:MAG: hypothetical protein A4S09_11685 [Proteobacteria bacterium SG_bin7]|nr:MAG: hypothetical protein A4S09_11685 [Proteobacteria bacterium SG_bin7]
MRLFQIFILFFSLVMAQSAVAVSNRILWIPDIKGMQEDVCRFEMQDLVTAIRQSNDSAGERFSLSFGGACGIYESDQIRFEAGMDWIESHDFSVQSLSDALFGQFQIQFFDIDRRHWGLALGAYDIGFKSGGNNFNVIYMMALHQAGPFRFGLGGYSGNSQVLRNGDGESDYQGAMLGVWKKITNGDLGIEMQTGFNRYGYLFLGGRYIIGPKTFAVAGYGKANDTKIARDWVLLRLGFLF